MEPLTNIPEDHFFYKSFTSRHLVEIIIDETSHFKNFDHLLYLLGMLFFRIGNYEKSFKYLDLYIKDEGYKLGNLGYYSCVLLYLKLKAKNFSTDNLAVILKNTYGENLSQKVIANLSNPEDCFKYFILPDCGNCSICPINKECYYDKWNEINTKIIQKIRNNPIKQEELVNIFKINLIDKKKN